MKGRLKYLVSAVAALAMIVFFGGHANGFDYKGPKTSPKMREATRPFQKPGQLSSVAGAPVIRSAHLSPYAVPFRRACEEHSTPTFQGRVWVNVDLPRHPAGSSVRAILTVNTGMGEVRKAVQLTGGRVTEISSDTLNFSYSAACVDNCIHYRVEGISFGDAKNIGTTLRKACVLSGEL